MNIQSTGNASAARQPLAERITSGNGAESVNGAAKTNAKSSATKTDSAKAVERNEETQSPAKLKEAVENINKSLKALSQDLEFSIDQDSNRTVVKVVDQSTKEVIRQIPSDEALEIAKALDTVKGLLIKQKA